MICLNFKVHNDEEFNTEKGYLGVLIANTVMLRNNTSAF